MSFDLAVLASNGPLTPDEARRMFEQCAGFGAHRDGDLDPRIVHFYSDLTAQFPDHRPYDAAASPWMTTPLSTGIDHVIMHLSYGSRSDSAIEVVCNLAEQHGLVVFDPQFNEIRAPSGIDRPCSAH